MEIVHLTHRDYARQPWKNGGGTTTELCRDEAAARWRWRLSIADVERSGPFSDFAGYRRFIVLVEGRGMALAIEGAPPIVVDVPYRPLAFDGGSRTQCTLLDGPIRDLNLIVDEARLEATLDVRRLEPASAFRVVPAPLQLVHALAGRCSVAIDACRTRLDAGDTLRVDDGGRATLAMTADDASAVVALAALRPRPSLA